jgi:hypothetical protein
LRAKADACHKHHDRDQRSHFNPHFHPQIFRRFAYRGIKNLLWRAKLANKPCRDRWQLQRIDPIAFQAAKRSRPFAVNRHHQHRQPAAVLASPRSIGLTHAAV